MRTEKKRKVCVVTGTRAEYGLLYPVMKAIQGHPKLRLVLIATGMHLMPEFGHTVGEVEKDGFSIDAKVPIHSNGDTGAAMAGSLGLGITGITQALEQMGPDIVVVLGDRDEPLAAAIAGAHMNIPVVHIHGGDSTTGGCIDDSIRHAITRFAHIHFPATPKSAERLIKMGEEPWRIHIAGPLGIYAMCEADFLPKNKLYNNLGLDPNKPVILVVQHPVTTQVEKAPEQIRQTMEALVELGEQAVVIYPNADAGGRAMIEVIKEYEDYPSIKVVKNLPYLTFVSLMKVADVMMGNSSSAIVEAPFFRLPVVNIGSRQEGRERGANIIDVWHKKEEIVTAVERAATDKEFRSNLQRAVNPYDVERNGAEKIADVLSATQIDENLLQKRLTY